MAEQQPHFLRLPYNIRRSIYRDLWMIVNYRSPLSSFHRGEWSSREQRLVEQDDYKIRFPNQLFYVSRAISEDARAMFYSENSLEFNDEYPRAFNCLLNLSPLGWKSLRSLLITIGTKDCTHWLRPETWKPYRDCHGAASDRIEHDNQLEASGVLSTWAFICSQLATYITEDDQLELHLVCGAASQDNAASFLAPIQDLPRLKGLSIRMGPHRDFDILQMIMTTIRQKTLYFPQDPKEPFPFQRLPVEIQIRVLEYSGLMVPSELRARLPGEPFVPTDCRRFECGALPIGSWYCGGCHCPATHTAFSTVYTCCAATIPHALFLVSKAIRELALFVYYARNTIEIWYQPPAHLPLPPVLVTTPSEPRASGFLSQVPEHSSKHLRHIHWVFPSSMRHGGFYPGSGEMSDWTNTLGMLFRAVQPCAIVIEISFERPGWADFRSVDPSTVSGEWALYERIVEPVARHRGLLKDFFVRTNCHMYTDKTDPGPSRERFLEQKVMGAEYESLLRGKVERDTF
ncbi:uncharacterized protein BJX67DRAFT_382276 [Aspergillus lucknowensis]|uniref:Uncharacterized protein n=1 Tax=Aspergillus lucknowensis TaxID=176173 RepID=A0ABR4LP53_9EURO